MDASLKNEHVSKDALLFDKLPPELLGRIFSLGTVDHRSFRKPYSKGVGFQDIVVQVCRHWREVGIRAPALWTSVLVSNTPSYQRAQLYLSRVGPTLPLDIELAIEGSDSRGAVGRTRRMLEHVVLHDGGIGRWRNLVVCAENPEAIFHVFGFLNSAPTPALRFVSFERRFNSRSDGEQEEKAMRAARSMLGESHSLSGGPQRPQLFRVELMGLTSGFIFNRTEPLLSNLRHLKLACSRDPYPVHSIGKLLSASPQLESLCLDIGNARFTHFEESNTTPPKVSLPSLRSFSLRTFNCSEWGVPLLQMIDAPAVESLRLSCKGGGFHPLLGFLCTGRLDGVLHSESSTLDFRCGPIYPSLRHLHLDDVNTPHKDWEQLIEAYFMVTEVTLGWAGFLAFVDARAALPYLSYIRYSGNIIDLSIIKQLIERKAQTAPTRLSFLRWGTRENMDKVCKIIGDALHGLVDRVEMYDDNNDFTDLTDYRI